MAFLVDQLVFSPNDIDLQYSPLRQSIQADTYVLGAFNPGLTRLPSGNLLIMIRVAEALNQPIIGETIHAIRWDAERGYHLDTYPLNSVNAADPRKFQLLGNTYKVMALTSLSWLLPVELTADGTQVVRIHYDKIIAPQRTYQEYGVEDARITKIDDTYYMTTCSVSSERHSTTLYTSTDGLTYTLNGIILDHQNKDMVFFEGKISGRFFALTRPLGDLYFATRPESPYYAGPSINLAQSPDGLHWKPLDEPFIRARKGTASTMKLGGGTQPVLTDEGWLMLYHGVELRGQVGIYRTFWALLDKDDPTKILYLDDKQPVLEANPALIEPIKDQLYLSDVVFTTGLVDAGDYYIVASGECDLACRITHIPKDFFTLSDKQ
ncbi:glycosidase [Spirosoma oryzicola]|uniref:glycoside hydrolase family 130 protein n=1 Tax=Spirosoma oryzicola TaxID=2898794 RepID=UPI001E52A35D|nr:glycosidase [Spirosoma oryzicola]UHG94241.1 glycosidase [Spirosoma oryzicola]